MQNNDSNKKKINKINLALSIAIAFAAWLYVVYSINPTITRTYSNIPVTVVNSRSLAKNDLAVSKMDTEKISVTLVGRRSAINDLKKSEVSATVNAANADKGENRIAVQVAAPGAVTVKSQSESSISVTVEDLEVKKVSSYTTYKDGQEGEPVVKKNSNKEVEVQGAASLIKNVDSVKLELDANNVTDKAKEFSVPAIPVDGSGHKIDYLTTDPGKISVTAYKGETKVVKLKIKVTNNQDGSVSRTYSAPNTIVIKGRSKDIKGVTEITSKDMDISSITETKDVNIDYDLPEGVSIANESRHVMLRVKVSTSASKTVNVPAGSININNVASGHTATANSGVNVIVTGSKEKLVNITAGSFVISADAGGLGAGQHTVTVYLTNNSGMMASLESAQINITIQ
ncbi:CdaR family protein [Mogibacterium pumilum]|uniref:YbbR-like protein n=1 Tax=Mogibacterium pumilum TaxID=86332 RepID=A0A223ARD8_9FIRM|nr:CdaR family protein [Mogibacterium pumilum]ASS37533.1 hypothetical protein AXF17_03040 [Mogibacterium pumilum]